MDIVFEEMFEELKFIYDFEDDYRGGQESIVDFLDERDDDISLAL